MNSLLSKLFYRLRTSPAVRLGAVFFLILLCFTGTLLFRAVTDPYDCRIVDGISIDGVDLSGLTKGEAKKALRTAAEETILSQPLTVVLPEETLTFAPKDIKLKLNVRQAVADAYAVGRKTEPQAVQNRDLSAYLRFVENTITSRLQAYASAYDTTLTEHQFRLEGSTPDLTENGFHADSPCPNLILTLGTPEQHLDIAEAQLQIQKLYCRGISAFRSGENAVSVTITPEQLPQPLDVDDLYSQFAAEATDARADLETFQILPATYGLVFDRDAAQSALDAASYGDTISLPMIYQTPEVFSVDIPFRDVLGSCETKHTDDENRNTNLRLVCEILDGYTLQPGEEFSYNGVIGERTEERGFKPAGAYSGTRLVKDIGGGVCQGSSTLYNCVLLADLEVTERVCHGLLVNYLPIGMDAAVNWSTKTDFKFRNNFHFPVQIRARLEDGYMKMQIVGVDEKDYYIEMRSGRSDEELRIYSNSYKYKYSKETGELISKELEARSSYMYFT